MLVSVRHRTRRMSGPGHSRPKWAVRAMSGLPPIGRRGSHCSRREGGAADRAAGRAPGRQRVLALDDGRGAAVAPLCSQTSSGAAASSSATADPAALSHADREPERARTILLACERDESALVWQVQAQNLPVEHRADCAPQAILQCRLVTAPPVNASPGTSPGHSFA
jgi:hypothetical protein